MSFRWIISKIFGFWKVTVTGRDIAKILRERSATEMEVQTVLGILDAVQTRFGERGG